MNQHIPDEEELRNFYDVVIKQDTPELEFMFTVNWLRGTIKIPKEVRMRIYLQMKKELEEC